MTDKPPQCLNQSRHTKIDLYAQSQILECDPKGWTVLKRDKPFQDLLVNRFECGCVVEIRPVTVGPTTTTTRRPHGASCRVPNTETPQWLGSDNERR